MTNTKTEQLWEVYATTRDTETRNALFAKYKHLLKKVRNITQSHLSGSILDRNDAKALRSQGLLEAIEKYDPEKDTPFERFAYIYLEGRVYDALRETSTRPRSSVEALKTIRVLREDFYKVHGRNFHDAEELAVFGQIEEEVIARMLQETETDFYVNSENYTDPYAFECACAKENDPALIASRKEEWEILQEGERRDEEEVIAREGQSIENC